MYFCEKTLDGTDNKQTEINIQYGLNSFARGNTKCFLLEELITDHNG